MARVVHFELPVDNPERAAAFYRDALGWEISKWEGPEDYWLVGTGSDSAGGAGIDGALIKRSPPNVGVVNTVDVPSVDEYVERVTKAGGKVVAPKMTVPGVGYLVYCQDTEGNVFGMMQRVTR